MFAAQGVVGRDQVDFDARLVAVVKVDAAGYQDLFGRPTKLFGQPLLGVGKGGGIKQQVAALRGRQLRQRPFCRLRFDGGGSDCGCRGVVGQILAQRAFAAGKGGEQGERQQQAGQGFHAFLSVQKAA